MCCFGDFFWIAHHGRHQRQPPQTEIPAAEDLHRGTRHQARTNGGRGRHPDGATARQGDDDDPVWRDQEGAAEVVKRDPLELSFAKPSPPISTNTKRIS